MMHQLIQSVFVEVFDSEVLRRGNDGADLGRLQGSGLVVSTDAHVVHPLEFPGGDIGRLAVCGTVNDVAMMGARPLFLTAGFVLEEGLEMALLKRIVTSMKAAADEAGVQIVAGDTKVVERGKADGIYITTAGVGSKIGAFPVSGQNARPGDAILLSGTLGDHGIAIVCARGDLGLETEIKSDVAPLNGIVEALCAIGARLHVMRDPTRGGLATTLNEIARQSGVGMLLDEEAIPVRGSVRAACEILGFDPLYIANEGKFVALVEESAASEALEILRRHPYGASAALIGQVVEKPATRVLLRTSLGSTRVVDDMVGELLPRIC